MDEKMMENKAPTSVPAEGSTAQTESEVVKPVAKPAVAKPDRTFTRDEVTTILRRRLERANNSLYQKYSVKDVNEFNALLDKAKSYDSLKQERDSFSERIAFMSNNINPDRYEDVRTYFKGKGMIFDEGVLKGLLESHPEWVNKAAEPVVNNTPKTTVKVLGTESHPASKPSDQARAEKMFGFKL